MRGGLEDRRPVRANLGPRELELAQKTLHRSVTAENDAPESRLRPFVGPARAYGTPDFDPSEPIPFALTWFGHELAKAERVRAELGARRRARGDDELTQEEELELDTADDTEDADEWEEEDGTGEDDEDIADEDGWDYDD